LPALANGQFPDAEWLSAVDAALVRQAAAGNHDNRKSSIPLLFSALRLTQSAIGKIELFGF
jgi:hypothetical protein